MKAIITNLDTGDETLIQSITPKEEVQCDSDHVWHLREETIEWVIRRVYETAYPERFNARFKLAENDDRI